MKQYVWEVFPTAAYMILSLRLKNLMHVIYVCICMQLGAVYTVTQKPHSIQYLHQKPKNSAFAGPFKLYSENSTDF